MSVFFDLAYALVVFLALAVAGAVPGLALGLLVARANHLLLLPAVALALFGWIWVGWIGGRYGISRVGLVLFAAVGAAGFLRGWLTGFEQGIRIRRRRGTDVRSPRRPPAAAATAHAGAASDTEGADGAVALHEGELPRR